MVPNRVENQSARHGALSNFLLGGVPNILPRNAGATIGWALVAYLLPGWVNGVMHAGTVFQETCSLMAYKLLVECSVG